MKTEPPPVRAIYVYPYTGSEDVRTFDIRSRIVSDSLCEELRAAGRSEAIDFDGEWVTFVVPQIERKMHSKQFFCVGSGPYHVDIKRDMNWPVSDEMVSWGEICPQVIARIQRALNWTDCEVRGWTDD